jgi:hypothetical protein
LPLPLNDQLMSLSSSRQAYASNSAFAWDRLNWPTLNTSTLNSSHSFVSLNQVKMNSTHSEVPHELVTEVRLAPGWKTDLLRQKNSFVPSRPLTIATTILASDISGFSTIPSALSTQHGVIGTYRHSLYLTLMAHAWVPQSSVAGPWCSGQAASVCTVS